MQPHGYALIKQILEKSNPNLIFRSFEGAIPTVVLARKGGIDTSKPIKHPRFIENLCKTRSTQAIKVFAELFSKSENPNPLNFHTTTI